jgi:hypothetical protein
VTNSCQSQALLPDVEVLTGGQLQLPPEVSRDRIPVLVAGQEVVDSGAELLRAHEVLQHSAVNTFIIYFTKFATLQSFPILDDSSPHYDFIVAFFNSPLELNQRTLSR